MGWKGKKPTSFSLDVAKSVQDQVKKSPWILCNLWLI